ncbi:hypothetical protein X915_gp118 [Bacillus phage vB_BanS-Tsamsa]|uniref:Uncharacterized protein n=1 Tax=Bacillus phage vB_BanS-Tsamsa TaxID=1308863 RepID=U5J9Y0_9CAUD|nr:hypothetical protein X915_gp118 [Bacillus phage vB_BanS-Tsamsa]AGI11840.1 hypothetical protein [Bacillus phage vB_BanS-Tsamsa]
MEGLKLIEQVFADVIEEYGSMDLYEIEDLEGVTEYDDDIDYNDDWYNFHIVTFKYKGKYYSFEYKRHTSDNVCDTEYFYGTFKEIKILKPLELFGGIKDDFTLNKDTFTQAEVITLLHLSPYQIHQLLKEVEDNDI